MSETRDLVAELMAGEQQAPAMPDARKTRRKRKLPTAGDTKSKRSQQVESPTYKSSSSSSGGDTGELQNKTLPPGTPIQRIGVDLPWSCPIPETVQQQQLPVVMHTPVERRYPAMGKKGYHSTPSTKQAAPNAPAKAKPQEVRLPLGNDMFLTVALFRDKPLVSVRQFYRPVPTDVNKMRAGRQGLSMSPQHWEALKEQPLLAAILDCTYAAMSLDGPTFQPVTYELGDQRYVSVQIMLGQPCVSLYQMYRPYGSPATTKLVKKGIDLTLEQWNDLETKMEAVDKILAAMEDGKMPADKEVIQSSVVY